MDPRHNRNATAHRQGSPTQRRFGQQSPAPRKAAFKAHQTPKPKPKPKYTDNKPTVRLYCKAKRKYSLTIRDGLVVMAPTNSSDLHQHWIKELKFNTEVKDIEGFSSFALINKATGQALKHAAGAREAVQLTRYNPDKVDNSVLWTQRKNLGNSFHTIRMVNNIKLNLDIASLRFNNGNIVGVGKSTGGDNQSWGTAPYILGLTADEFVWLVLLLGTIMFIVSIMNIF